MSNKLYTTIPAPKVPRNVFNLSRYNSLTMPYQRVCPVALQEIIPGDKFNWSAELFCRLQPMQAPVMTDQKISLHSFFVPLRTVNSHFAEFMFNNKSGNYTGVLPYVDLSTLYKVTQKLIGFGSTGYPVAAEMIRLFDYLGLPFSYRSATTAQLFCSQWLTDNISLKDSIIRVNLAPFFAYTKVWSEYFRDENLVDDPFEQWKGYGYTDVFGWTGNCNNQVNNSNNTITERFCRCFLVLRPRAWQHDRFTSSLPFAQRGPDVLLPVTGSVNISPNGPDDNGAVSWTDGNLFSTAADPTGDSGDIIIDGEIGGVSTTINDFRRAERLQRWYENSARGGNRPNEAILAHFGVHTPDATLDRAEFLGGSMQPIVVSEVAQTSESTQSSPQGTLAGKGTSYKAGNLFNHFFTEHGFVFVFASALIRPAYWQGVPRVFSRMQRDEYYWPEFALLGEEPVFDKELFVDGSTTEDGVFGYVPRYADYKSAVPECHGDFRSSLDFWINPRKFANQPQLNEEFIFGNPQKKMFAVQSDYADSLLVTIRHGVKASRLMPFYGVPTI